MFANVDPFHTWLEMLVGLLDVPAIDERACRAFLESKMWCSLLWVDLLLFCEYVRNWQVRSFIYLFDI